MSDPLRHRRNTGQSVLSGHNHEAIGPVFSAALPDTNASKKLLNYDEIPSWHQENKHILSGYRPETNSTKMCFASWFYIHNETANIYSHLMPAIAAFIAEMGLYRFFQVRYPDSTIADRVVFAIFLMAAVICLGLSSGYHTLMNHSASTSNLWLRFDYVGIIILVIGTLVPGTYMVFYCKPALQVAYWSMICALGLTTTVLLVIPKFEGPRFRTYRVSAIVLTGLSGFAPLIHGLIIFGLARMIKQSGLLYYLVEGLLFIIGAIVYATRVPERIRPGKFDIWGCSHQIFHVLVVAAATVHAVGILKAFDYNYRERECGV